MAGEGRGDRSHRGLGQWEIMRRNAKDYPAKEHAPVHGCGRRSSLSANRSPSERGSFASGVASTGATNGGDAGRSSHGFCMGWQATGEGRLRVPGPVGHNEAESRLLSRRSCPPQHFFCVLDHLSHLCPRPSLDKAGVHQRIPGSIQAKSGSQLPTLESCSTAVPSAADRLGHPSLGPCRGARGRRALEQMRFRW